MPLSLTEAEDRDALNGRLGAEEVPMLTTEVDLPKLTKRQREVLSLLAGGKSNKEIARALDIAEATTKIHMAALLRALGVRNRTEAAFKAGKLVNFPGLPAPLSPMAVAQPLGMNRSAEIDLASGRAADPEQPSADAQLTAFRDDRLHQDRHEHAAVGGMILESRRRRLR